MSENSWRESDSGNEDWSLPELAGWKDEPDDEENDDDLLVGGPLIGDILGPATQDIDWERFDALDRLFTAMGNIKPPSPPALRDAALKAVLAELTAAAAAVGNPTQSTPVQTGKPIRLRIEELWNQR